MTTPPYFPLELQTSAAARRRFALDDALLVPPPARNLFHLRLLADRLRPQLPPLAGSAAQLQLLALLNRALRRVSGRYLPPLDTAALTGIADAFVAGYPPAPQWPRGGAEAPRAVAVELLVLAVQTQNRAAAPLAPLFDAAELSQRCDWRAAVALIDGTIRGDAGHPLAGKSLLDLLLEPLRAAPDSLFGQLRFVRDHWGAHLPLDLLDDILVAFALVAEEETVRGGGPGDVLPPGFTPEGGSDVVRFSPDSAWMPNVVLMAKTIYVWLDQLSRAHGRNIDRLDLIPDEELDRLVARGFTSLWLIGIWERSPASEEIKRRMGNAEAVASAYSLFDYVVAADLGGEGALHQLRERCHGRGLRLACDVVPNHTGIDSRWTREHPDWYVQVDHPPWPSYTFNGPNLSRDPATEIYLEDGYWNHRDAAVVFKHVQGGRVRYLYHGNDGTHLPWNDTAQLNFLLPEVREAMIRTIVHVARSFPVIRFDAAMTLAKKHYQRLWFPQPGGGAGVPSRAEHALSRATFEQLFPVEFWREVVDRVAAEAPDTLLLAEAFWLMEGYFVRTLGMHRVYNSAFMNMLKHEENAKYRKVLADILAFEPGILQRFVNFMNNPDEETAVAQFGKHDKYFGVAILLATLPGLPMFGHGQIEGLEEKYGMEYRRAYRDEHPDAGFIAHHERLIFPLLRRRALFSGAEHFELYPLDGEGSEHLYAFSNRNGEERALVLVNNHDGAVHGRLRETVPKRRGETATPSTLLAALAFADVGAPFVCCRDHVAGLDYLFHRDELATGLSIALPPRGSRVLLDWQLLDDTDGSWALLHRNLGGAPVADLPRCHRRLAHAELHQRFAALLADQRFGAIWHDRPAARDSFARDFAAFCQDLCAPLPEGTLVDLSPLWDDYAHLAALPQRPARRRGEAAAIAPLSAIATSGPEDPATRLFLLWLALERCAPLALGEVAERLHDTGLDEVLDEEFAGGVIRPGLLLPLLLRHAVYFSPPRDLSRALRRFLDDPAGREALGWHSWDDAHYIGREAFEELAAALFRCAAVLLARNLTPGQLPLALTRLHRQWTELRGTAAEAAYRLENFLFFD